MKNNNLYIPANQLIKNKENTWTYISVNLSHEEIVKKGIIRWCSENVDSKWTILGNGKFGFEDAADATIFKIQFDLNSQK